MNKEIDKYKTISTQAEGIYKEKGSKFIAHALPVQNEDEIQKQLDQLRAQYHDARHHCYAYRLGPEKKVFRANDDGEPSSSAGKPILGQIKSYDLTNILIVVIRYFGGIKLGVGGLIQAYKTAAEDALKNAKIIEVTLHDIYRVSFEYSEINEVMRILKEENAKQIDQQFDTSCAIDLQMERNYKGKLLKRLEILQSTKIEYIVTK